MTTSIPIQTLSERELEPSTIDSWEAFLGLSAVEDFAHEQLVFTPPREVLPPGGEDRASADVVNLENYRAFRRAEKALQSFAKLSKGWDSYNGEPPNKETGEFAYQIIRDVVTPMVPEPQLFPTSPGGIQIEWHQKDLDLELHILAPFNCELWYRIPSTGQEDILHMTTDFSPLNEWIARLQPRQ